MHSSARSSIVYTPIYTVTLLCNLVSFLTIALTVAGIAICCGVPPLPNPNMGIKMLFCEFFIKMSMADETIVSIATSSMHAIRSGFFLIATEKIMVFISFFIAL